MPDFENAAPVQEDWDPSLERNNSYTPKEDSQKKQKKEEKISLFDNYDEEEEEGVLNMGQESNSNQYVEIRFDSENEALNNLLQNMSQETIDEMSEKGAWVNYSKDNDDFGSIDVDGDGMPGETVGLSPEEQEKASKIIPFEQQYLLDNLPEGKYVTENDIQMIHKDYKAILNDKTLSENENVRKAHAKATRKEALDNLIKNAPTYDAFAIQKEQFAKGNNAEEYKVYRKNDSNKLVETTIGSRTLNEALKQKMEKNQKTVGKLENAQGQTKHTVKSGAQQFISGEAEQMSKGTLIMTAGAALLLIRFLREKGLEKANEVLKDDVAKGIQLKDGMTLEQALKECLDDLKDKQLGKEGPDTKGEEFEDDSLSEEESKEEQKEEPEEVDKYLEENDKDESSKEEPNNELENPELEEKNSSKEEKDMFDELADDLNDLAAPTGEPIDMEAPELEETIDGMEI